MKTLVLSMISIAATIAAMTACTSESDPINERIENNQPTPVIFGSSISEITSKAIAENDNAFGANEEIGITMYTTATQAEPTGDALGTPNKANVTFVSDASGKFTEKSGTTMFWQREAYHYFYAYYPVTTKTNENYKYTAATGSTPEQITVKVQADGTATDLLMGKNTNGTLFEGIVPSETKISFSHMLSKIKFVFIKDNSYTKDGNLTEISFKVNNESITYNLVNPSNGTPSATTGVTLTNTGLTYKIEENSANAAIDWAPIVIPGSTVTDLNLKIDGATLSSSSINGLVLQAGFMTKIIITLKSSGTELTSDIVTWQDGGTNGTTEVQ